jgi:hypothetical protein
VDDGTIWMGHCQCATKRLAWAPSLAEYTVRSGTEVCYKAGLYQGYTLGYTRGSQQVLDALKLEVGNLIKERKDG